MNKQNPLRRRNEYVFLQTNLNGAINGVSCSKPLIRLFAESRHRNR